MPANKRTSKPGGDLDRHNSLERHDNRVGCSIDGCTEFDRERRRVGTTGTGMDLEGLHHSPRRVRRSCHLASTELRAANEFRGLSAWR